VRGLQQAADGRKAEQIFQAAADYVPARHRGEVWQAVDQLPPVGKDGVPQGKPKIEGFDLDYLLVPAGFSFPVEKAKELARERGWDVSTTVVTSRSVFHKLIGGMATAVDAADIESGKIAYDIGDIVYLKVDWDDIDH
jgi:hypothetical protein